MEFEVNSLINEAGGARQSVCKFRNLFIRYAVEKQRGNTNFS